jgi:autotransporter translocation and assembly factor TamB
MGDFQGIINGNLSATGSFQDPDLKGNLSMVQGKYFLDLTGMNYNFEFKISTENSNLLIDYIRLFNPNDDTRHIDMTGFMDFKGYQMNNINLTTSGDMVLLDKSSKDNKFGISGYLLGGIGTPPITITGNTKKLNVKGQFLVKEATINSLPKSGNGYQIDDKNIVYLSANDSAIVSDTNRRKLSLVEYERINPFMRDRFILFDTNKTFSIMKILSLDLNVKTVKNLNISIDFKNLTRDRLFGEVSADLRIRSDSGRLRTRGEVDIVGNSYYRFYRNFKVKDSRIIFRGPIDKPELDIRAVYENTKSTEQFGSITSSPIQVVLTVTGNPSTPEITLRLYENGTEMQGNDATSDAITFLLFGKYKNELSASESQSIASGIGSTVGSLYVTSFFGQLLRSMLPMIKDAELNYTEGGIQNTNVSVTSDLFNTDVTVGSRVIDKTTYLEFNVEYPLENLVTLNLPEKVLLQIAREQLSRNVISNSNVYYSTGAKIIYKFKF